MSFNNVTGYLARHSNPKSHDRIPILHDGVIKCQLCPRYWPFVLGIHQSPVKSPYKGKWRGALVFSLISARKNGSVNNRQAGDLRRHCAHYIITDTTAKGHTETMRMIFVQTEGILPKGPYPPCVIMADRALLAGYPRDMSYTASLTNSLDTHQQQ